MYLAEKIKILFTVAVAVKAVCKYCSSFRLWFKFSFPAFCNYMYINCGLQGYGFAQSYGRNSTVSYECATSTIMLVSTFDTAWYCNTPDYSLNSHCSKVLNMYTWLNCSLIWVFLL
jgi:hypothetical protein